MFVGPLHFQLPLPPSFVLYTLNNSVWLGLRISVRCQYIDRAATISPSSSLIQNDIIVRQWLTYRPFFCIVGSHWFDANNVDVSTSVAIHPGRSILYDLQNELNEEYGGVGWTQWPITSKLRGNRWRAKKRLLQLIPSQNRRTGVL